MSYTLSSAYKTALRIQEILAPHCILFHIAGSIRRNKAEVKDIEIVCIPKKQQRSIDMFGGTEEIICNEFSAGLIQIMDTIIKGKVTGRMMQIQLKGGMMLDLFLPDKDDYYRQLAIRTGSADYSHKVIAAGWYRKGWVGTAEGLRRRNECDGGGKYSWRCKKKDPTLPPAWQSEEEFFQWIGVEWVSPEYREYNETIKANQ